MIGLARLFGTDGVRGVANRELTPEIAYSLGRNGAYILMRKSEKARPRVVVGRDTRASGSMLEAALVAGITSVGADVLLVGVIPTPGVAYLTRAWGADAGVMISASHNPVEDNGIKFFSRDGYKLLDAVEEEIENLMLKEQDPADIWGTFRLPRNDGLPRPQAGDIGRVYYRPDGVGAYCQFLAGTVAGDFAGLEVVVDCGNGAAWEVAPRVLQQLGASVKVLNDTPNGININVGCGSTNPEVVAEAVLEYGAAVGLAHDGDADRVIAVDEKGQIVDGDHILAICGLHLLRRGRLTHNRIAATVYSNLGLKAAMQAAGGDVTITPNGDRYVLEAMRREGLTLGGEQSGHIIFLEHNTTGDGVLTAVQLLSIMQQESRPLSELAGQLIKFPQILRNVRVTDKAAWKDNPRIKAAIETAEVNLGPEGRVLVRASGTEPVIRVMVEGPEKATVERAAETVVAAIKAELGVGQ